MILARWSEISSRLAEALESPDPESFILTAGDPDLAQLFAWHRRAGSFMESRFSERINPWLGRLVQGRYRLESVLGRGGAGVVYRARDERVPGRQVVVKLLHDFWSSEDWMRRRFLDEAQMLARMDHPGIVSLIDAGEIEDGRLFLVLPFHDGRTLRDALASGPLDVAFAARLLREIGDAVGYAHGQGVMHRDLKPENILLVRREDGEHSMLIDFGIAQIGEVTASPKTTTHLLGSAVYMAPEHLMGKPTAASDVYSMGVIAWEMLTGIRPFETGSPFELPEMQRRGVGDAFYRLRPDLGIGIGKLLSQALDYDPGRRPSRIAAFTSKLADALAVQSLDSRFARLWMLRGSRRWMLAGGGAVLTGAAAGGWLLRDRLSPLSSEERVIEYLGGFTPEMAGFERIRDIDYQVIRDFSTGRIESARVSSKDQAQVRRRLTDRQARQALDRGWRMSALMRPESGYCGVNVVCSRSIPLFQASFDVRPSGVDLVATLGIRNGWVGDRVAVKLPAAPGLLQLTMEYSPESGTVDIGVDGSMLIRNYPGVSEYQVASSVVFAVGSTNGQLASSIFGGLHFEILG